MPMILAVSGNFADWGLEGLRDTVRRADEAGVEAILLPDEIAPASGGEAWPDALILIGWLAAVTKRLRFLAAVSSLGHQPYNVARRLASLDLISRGRAGWVVAEGDEEASFAAFSGATRLAGIDLAARDKEFVQVVEGLWGSWDADALLLNKEGGRFFEPDGMHRLDHEGEHFSVRGPLNVMPWNGGRPRLMRAAELTDVVTVESAAAAAALLGGSRP